MKLLLKIDFSHANATELSSQQNRVIIFIWVQMYSCELKMTFLKSYATFLIFRFDEQLMRIPRIIGDYKTALSNVVHVIIWHFHHKKLQHSEWYRHRKH